MQRGIINPNVASMLTQGKNVILNNIESNIEKTFADQLTTGTNLEAYMNNWKTSFEKQDFNSMEDVYKRQDSNFQHSFPQFPQDLILLLL